MPFPDYEKLADALLCFIYLYGGSNYQVCADSTYEPLADYFELGQRERSRPRPDGYSGLQWHNRVQWTRQRLINQGYVEGRDHGLWGLTAQGMSRARSIVSCFSSLKKP